MNRLLTWAAGHEKLMIHAIWIIVALLFFFAGFIGGYSLNRQDYYSDDVDGWPLALVTRVIDGDTIIVDWMGQQERVRILGIDAPETRRTRTFHEQVRQLGIDEEFLLAYANIATQVVENWLKDRKVRLVFGGAEGEIIRDAFGRLLAYVELDGVDIGERLLLGGNAIVYEDNEHPRIDTYRLFQEEARRKRRGIWRNI